jgi:hypothetical protein
MSKKLYTFKTIFRTFTISDLDSDASKGFYLCRSGFESTALEPNLLLYLLRWDSKIPTIWRVDNFLPRYILPPTNIQTHINRSLREGSTGKRQVQEKWKLGAKKALLQWVQTQVGRQLNIQVGHHSSPSHISGASLPPHAQNPPHLFNPDSSYLT